MKYKGFYIDITPDDHLVRTDSSGNEVICRGFSFSVFTDEARTEKFDEFSAAVGYEILAEDMEEAEQFAKDSHSRLGKIKNATQGYFTIEDRDSNTPHIKKVRVVTNVDFYLR